MTREEHLYHCERCTLRKMDPKQGLVCSLTDQPASFEGTCPDFNEEEASIARRTNAAASIRSLENRDTLAERLVLAVMIMDIISMVSSYFQLVLLQGINDGLLTTDAEAEANDNREMVIGIVYLIVFIVSAVTFIRWFRRIYANHAARNNAEQEEKWALWSWFVPIVNLYRPYHMMREVWSALTTKITRHGKHETSDKIQFVTIWWSLWIISNFVGDILLRQTFRGETVNDYIMTTIGDMVLSALGIPLAIVTVAVIRNISEKETLVQEIQKEEMTD